VPVMLKLAVTVLPCVFLLASIPGASAEEDQSGLDTPHLYYYYACSDVAIEDLAACIGTRRAMAMPCTGSVEERLSCIEKRVISQERDIVALKRTLDRYTNPRARPLGMDARVSDRNVQ
jgi:hypothetical protein